MSKELDATKLNGLRAAVKAQREVAGAERAKLQNLETELFEERIRLAALGYGAPFPLGSRVKRTIQDWRNKVTVETGTVECVTRENAITFSSAKSKTLGSFVVRLDRKDGTPGKDFVDADVRWGVKWELCL